MRKLSVIFFDVDDTIYSTTEFTERARAASLRAMLRAGLRMDEEALRRELSEVVREFSSNYEHHFDKLLLRLAPESYAGVNPALIVAAGVTAYHDTKFRDLRPYEDALAVLKILYDRRKLLLGIITAGVAVKQAEKLLRLGVISYINPGAVFISDQLGISKKNPKLYLKVCETVGFAPAECMYIGDNPPVDIDPPNCIGMITVLNLRSGKHRDEHGETRSAYTISNFWDLLELLERDFGC